MLDLNPSLLAVIGIGLAVGVLCVMGANDVANVLGTAYGAGALRPPVYTASQSAWARVKGAVPLVLFAGIFEFTGALFAGASVTEHVGEQLVTGGTARQRAVSALGTLLASFCLVAGSTVAALPVSASHATASAIVAAGAFQAWQQGRHANITSPLAAGDDPTLLVKVRWSSVLPMVVAWVISPIIGFLSGYVLYFICGAQCTVEEMLGLPILAGTIVGSLSLFVFIAGPPDLKSLLGRWTAPAAATTCCLAFTSTTVIFLIRRRDMLTRYADAPFISPASTVPANDVETSVAESSLGMEPRAHSQHYAKGLRLLMIFTAAAIAFAHGGNGKCTTRKQYWNIGTSD
jgi:phosphate/sulfate permease